MERRLLGQAGSRSRLSSCVHGSVHDLELSKNNETVSKELKIFGNSMKNVDKLDLIQPHD
jgi:hypothetical protein